MGNDNFQEYDQFVISNHKKCSQNTKCEIKELTFFDESRNSNDCANC